MKVFVIEDQRIILRGICKIIKEICQAEVYAFEDAETALEAIARYHPDAIFTDIVMEGMDGLVFIKKASILLPECRFVIISGFAEFEYARQAITLNVHRYLLKPIQRTQLEEILLEIKDGGSQHAPEVDRCRNISEEAISYITAHSDQPLTVNEIASHIHISPNYLSNLFSKKTGISVTEAIRSEKMKTAGRLLRETNMYLYEIAEKLGYKDVKYFSALFREYHKISPKSYRLQYDGEYPNEPNDFT